MKNLDVAEIVKREWSEESRQAMLDEIILQQIGLVEKLLEGNTGYVKSPLSYNACVQLVAQLKFYAIAAFRDANLNLDKGEPEWRKMK